MYPFVKDGRKALSYHRNRGNKYRGIKQWERRGDWVLLRTVDIGQEFVLDLEHYDKANHWLRRIFCHAG
jgi:hypothetical protein